MDVTIYTTPTCPWCKKTKDLLDEHDIAYDEKNVAEDSDAATEMVEKSDQRGVPVTVVDDGDTETVIVGFDEDQLEETLGID